MITSTCPYLGLKEDPATALNFSSDGNYCHKVTPAVPINRAHQMNYCLVAEHVRCPVFVKDEKALLPLDAVSPTHRMILLGRMFWGIIIPVMLVLIGTVAAAWWTSRSNPPTALPELEKNITKFPVSVSDATPGLPVTGPNTTTTPLSPFTGFGPTAVCGPPTGWVVYTVQPTDSIFLLSLVYGVSVEELQQANCLGENTIIRPGDQFYVPRPATPTPTQTPTATTRPRIRIVPTNTPAPGPVNPPPPVDPTSAPTTAVPTIAVPTIAVPTIAVPTATVGPPVFPPTPTSPPPVFPTTPVEPTPEPEEGRPPTRTPRPTRDRDDTEPTQVNISVLTSTPTPTPNVYDFVLTLLPTLPGG